MKGLGKIVASGLGTGYLPVAPGTWGSVAVAAIWLLASWATGGDLCIVGGVMIAVLVVSSVACVGLGRFVERAWGKKDPGRCTIDEWAGQALALVVLPIPADAGWPFRIGVLAGAFLAFRIFDIVKPPPARQCEKLPYGWGVLVDDLVAGVYAAATVWIVVTIVV